MAENGVWLDMTDLLEGRPDIANVMVSCPMPQHAHLGAMTLGEFLETEDAHVLGDTVKNVIELEGAGIDPEKALTIALGAAAVRDESGQLVRRPAAGGDVSQIQPEVAEPKKKLKTSVS